jgi:PleD family two-component response regulator
MLTQFTDMALNALNALKKFAELNEDKQDWRAIEAIIPLLDQLKSGKYLPDLYALSNARGKGDSRLAALHAKTVTEDFNRFSYQIISAKTDALPDGAPGEQSSLKELIQFLDDEEAGRKMLVLAVDDSPDILTAVATVLSKTYKVFKLPKPEMLESVLAQVTPELFLLDYKMPGLSGFDLVPVIRSFEEHTDTPIIFLTSEGTMDHVSAAIALGACDFIVKPFQADMLTQKVAKHIVRKKKF